MMIIIVNIYIQTYIKHLSIVRTRKAFCAINNLHKQKMSQTQFMFRAVVKL